MKLTPAQKSKIETTFRFNNPKCPVCGENKFLVDENVYNLMSLVDEGQNINFANSAYINILAVTCTKCGHILYFNLGL